MNLKNYIDIILRRKWVVVITVLVTMAVVAAGTWLMKPTFNATATLRIATASVSSSYQDYQFADRLINTYIIIATSQPLLDELDKQLNLSRPPKIGVQSIANTELITISVEDPDPNLAYQLAQSSKRAILVDGDCRLSSVHNIFNIPNKLGLCDYLLGKAEVNEIIQPTIYPNLSIITSGRLAKEPVNLLSSDRMKNLLIELRKQNDLVLVDSSSVLAVTDASVIAPLVDGVLLVAKRAFIGKEKLEATIEQLTNVKAKLLGLIINGENISENYYHYRDYSKKKEQ